MTTHEARTVQSIDSEEFRGLLIASRFYGDDPTFYTEGKDKLVAHINAWGVAQREEGRQDALDVTRQGVAALVPYGPADAELSELVSRCAGYDDCKYDVLALLQQDKPYPVRE